MQDNEPAGVSCGSLERERRDKHRVEEMNQVRSFPMEDAQSKSKISTRKEGTRKQDPKL